MDEQQAQINFSDAEKLAKLLLECTGVLSESVAYARQHCSNEFRAQFEPAVASVMADIGWELLERIFHQHPSLRPYKLESESGGKPTGFSPDSTD